MFPLRSPDAARRLWQVVKHPCSCAGVTRSFCFNTSMGLGPELGAIAKYMGRNVGKSHVGFRVSSLLVGWFLVISGMLLQYVTVCYWYWTCWFRGTFPIEKMVMMTFFYPHYASWLKIGVPPFIFFIQIKAIVLDIMYRPKVWRVSHGRKGTFPKMKKKCP